MAKTTISGLAQKPIADITGTEKIILEDNEATKWSYLNSAVTKAPVVQTLRDDVNALSDRFVNKASISLNTLKTSGMYYCYQTDSDHPVTGVPYGTAYSTWLVEVVASESGTYVNQIARPLATEGIEFERHYSNGVWTAWLETSPDVMYSGNLTTDQNLTNNTKYFRKCGGGYLDYGSFIILGSIAGVGTVLLGVRVSTNQTTQVRTVTVKDLMTGNDFSNQYVSIGYYVNTDANVAYLTVRGTYDAYSHIVVISG